MTQYYTDFSEYADTAAFNSAWAGTWSTSPTWSIQTATGTTGDKYLRVFASGATNSRGRRWNVVTDDPDRANVEVLAKLRTSTNEFSGGPGVFVRGSGALASETTYALQRLNASANYSLRRHLASNWTGATVLQGSIGSAVLPGWWWIRFRVNGDALKVRTWDDGDPEPETWAVEITDAEITAAGWVGVLISTAQTAEWDVFSVGTNGDTAPTSAPASGPTITNVPNMTRGIQATITGTGFGT